MVSCKATGRLRSNPEILIAPALGLACCALLTVRRRLALPDIIAELQFFAGDMYRPDQLGVPFGRFFH